MEENTIESLWGPEFDVEDTATKTKKVLKKIKSATALDLSSDSDEKQVKSKKVSLEEKLALIRDHVDKYLGKYRKNTLVIRDKKTLSDYIDKCIANNFISIDTETNKSLDPLTCKIMGACIHTFNSPQVYIPVNHIDNTTNTRLENQLTEQEVGEQFARLNAANTHVVMHHAKFDYQVLKCTCNVSMQVYWDTMIAARLLNENEPAGLKGQYADKVGSSEETYNIETFFAAVPYECVDPDTFALYAATDAYKTTGLYEWQLKQFDNPQLSKLRKLFLDTEMPIVIVSAEMELRGCYIDLDYVKRLSVKYHAELDKVDAEINTELQRLKPTIDAWKLTPEANIRSRKKEKKKSDEDDETEDSSSEPEENTFGKTKAEQLSDPIAITSSTQMAILFYDILKVGEVDTKTPRGTGVKILEKIAKKTKNPICDLVLQKRKYEKLLGTYIDKIPKTLNKADNRLHGEFNQLGTDTGRFASRNPNLQNIPSHLKDIRMMFAATQNVPATTAFIGNKVSLFKSDIVKSNANWIAANQLKEGDLIAVISNGVEMQKKIDKIEFVEPYYYICADVAEHTTLAFKQQYKMVGADFSQAEPRLLSCYSQDERMIDAYKNKRDLYATVAAEVYNNKYEDNLEFHADGSMNYDGGQRRTSCKSIILGIMYGRGSASIAEQIGKSSKEAQQIIDQFYDGFPKVKKWIDDTQAFCHEAGYVEDLWGRRRRLPDIKLPRYDIKCTEAKNNTLFNPILGCANRVDQALVDKYEKLLDTTYSRVEKESIKRRALLEGLEIHDNTGFIAKAERQCVNARVQGGSATITKRAMVAVYRDSIMRDLNFSTLLCIHDEIIGECPEENATLVAKRLTELMLSAPLPECNVPFKCDADISSHWYEENYRTMIRKEYEDNNKDFDRLCKNHLEYSSEALKMIVEEKEE